VGRSLRSNPATFVKAFDRVRERWARAPLSRERNYTPGMFSFNVAGGRCDVCEGAGVTKVEMYFLADLWVPCDACEGRRYRPEILQVRVHGLSMDEMLDRTIEEALRLFAGESEIQEPLGSVLSGGRYDNLAELYTNQQLPGIGASLGLDRLLAAMEELGMLPAAQTPAQVLIPYFDATRLGMYFQLATVLRAAGIATEVYPEPVKLGKQLQYADRKGFRIAVIAGEREFDAGQCQVKDLSSGASTTVSLANDATELVREVQRILAR
jgi:hypothetical protein